MIYIISGLALKINKSTNNLTKLIYLMILIFSISMCILSFFIYETSSSIVSSRAEKETLNLSDQVAKQLNNSIEMNINTLKSISQMIQTATNINDAITEQLKVLKQFEHIFIINNNGLIANIGPYKFDQISLNLNNSDYIKYVMQEKKPFISQPEDTFLGYKAIIISVPIFLDVGHGQWQFFGVICGSIRPENLFKSIRSLKLEKSGLAMVIDQNGNFLSYPNPNFIFTHQFNELDKKSSSIQKVQSIILNNSNGVARYLANGLSYIVGFQKMEYQNWHILISLPVDEVLIDVYELKRNTTIFTLIILFITIILTLIIKFRAQKLHTSLEDNFVALRNMQSKLITSSKMSALGEMAGGVAHEVNTPLGVITLRASQAKRMLEKENYDLKIVKNYLDVIENVAQQIAKIVQGLRAFSRSGENDRFALTSVRSIFDNTLILCIERLKLRNISLIDELQEKDFSLECRGVQGSQVLLNLINNACDAISSLDEKWIKISVREIHEKIQISVMNSGPRIPIEIRDKLMQPFFTTKDVGKGSGLGLSLSKGIVEAHGGRLYLDVVSSYTRFVAEFPKKPKTKF